MSPQGTRYESSLSPSRLQADKEQPGVQIANTLVPGRNPRAHPRHS